MQTNNPQFTPEESAFLADVKRRALAKEFVSAEEKDRVLGLARKYQVGIPRETHNAALRAGHSTAGIPVLQAA